MTIMFIYEQQNGNSQHVEGIIETSLNMDSNELIVKSTNYVECILYIGMFLL